MNRLFKLRSKHWTVAAVVKRIGSDWEKTGEVLNISSDSVFLQVTEPVLNEYNEWPTVFLTQETTVMIAMGNVVLLVEPSE